MGDSIGFCWTVADVKKYLGIDEDDPVIDAKIKQAMAITLSAVERYCNRLFGFRTEFEENIYKAKSDSWQLHLWPVTSQVWVEGEVCDELTVDNQAGILWTERYNNSKVLKVKYSGGYKECEFPPDLLAVLMGSVSVAVRLTTGELNEDSTISKVTIPDVGTITYDNSTNTNIGFGGAFIGGVVPMHWQSTLDFYRLHEC